MSNTPHTKIISQLTQAFSNASVAQFKSVLQQYSVEKSKEFLYSKKWKKMVATQTRHLTPYQAFGFSAAIAKHCGEEKPFQDFINNCVAFDMYLATLKTSQKMDT